MTPMTRVPGLSARGVRRGGASACSEQSGGAGGRDEGKTRHKGVSKTRHGREEFPDGYDRKRC